MCANGPGSVCVGRDAREVGASVELSRRWLGNGNVRSSNVFLKKTEMGH